MGRIPRLWGLLGAAVALALGLTAAVTWAGPATSQVEAKVDQVLTILQDPELQKPSSADRRRAQLRAIARTLFDFEEMARRSLARHWAPRTPEERKRFTELFSDLLEASYVGKIESYAGERILYLPEQADGDSVTVRSKLVTLRGTEIPIDYRMRQAGDRWQVYDVLVEGVSLIANYRSQFNKVIAQDSYAELVKRMEQKKLEVAEEQRAGKPGAKKP